MLYQSRYQPTEELLHKSYKRAFGEADAFFVYIGNMFLLSTKSIYHELAMILNCDFLSMVFHFIQDWQLRECISY